MRGNSELKLKHLMRGAVSVILLLFVCFYAKQEIKAATKYSETIDGVTWEISVESDGVVSIAPRGIHQNKVVIPEKVCGYTVTSIKDWAFSEAYALNEIIIPNTITKIGTRAFSLCTNLKSITIPNSVTEMGDTVFFWCESLETAVLSDHLKKNRWDISRVYIINGCYHS